MHTSDHNPDWNQAASRTSSGRPRLRAASRKGRLRGGLRVGLGFRRPIETRDSVHTDLRHRLLRAVSADECARLDLADNLEVGTFGECGRVFGCPATGHWLMEDRPEETMDALIAFL